MKGRSIATLVALVALAACFGTAAAAGSVLDGYFNLKSLGVPAARSLASVHVDVAPGVVLLVSVNGNATEAQYGVGVMRPDTPLVWDVYAVTGNYTVTMDPNSQTGNVAVFNNPSIIFGTLTRVAAFAESTWPKGTPNFEGAWDGPASDGSKMTCLRSLNAYRAYICLRNTAAAGSEWSQVLQKNVQFAYDKADVQSNKGAQTWVLDKDGNNLSIQKANTSTVIVVMKKAVLPLAAGSPPMAGLFLSNPVGQIMGCGTPKNAPASAFCVGNGLSPTGARFLFNVVERQSADGLLTTQFTSVGPFSSAWAGNGLFKRQFFLGQAPNGLLLTVGYRRDIVQTLIGSRVVDGVPVTCTGGSEENILCFGSSVTGKSLSTFNMAARGLGLGQYSVSVAFNKNGTVNTFSGPLSVTPDGLNLVFNVSQFVIL